MNRTITTICIALLTVLAIGQTGAAGTQGVIQDPPKPTAEEIRAKELLKRDQERGRQATQAENSGIEVRIKDVARFRGVRGNQLYGYGLVIGLDGTGDSRRTPFTMTLIQNAMKDFGTTFDDRQFTTKNVAAVAVTAELPPFAAPGNTIDITVTSIGDAKSLKGGVLLQTPLYPGANRTIAYVVGQGAVDAGGFSESANGNVIKKGHVTTARVPGGGIVEASVPTNLVFDGRMYLELNEQDFTSAERIAKAINARFEECNAKANDGGSVELILPAGMSPVQAISQIEKLTFMSDTQALVVINPRTGTVVIGGNVRIGPATIVHGSLKVVIESIPVVSQPGPFAPRGAQTVVGEETKLSIEEPTAQVALMPPTTTLADLTKILQELRVTPIDLMQILDALKRNGALKARIVVQ